MRDGKLKKNKLKQTETSRSLSETGADGPRWYLVEQHVFVLTYLSESIVPLYVVVVVDILVLENVW